MSFFVPQKIEKQLVEIREGMYREVRPIPHFKFWEGCDGALNAPADPAFDDGDWADFCLGDTWGGYDVTAWFRTPVAIPGAWRERRVYLRFQVGPRDGGGSTAETMLYVDGEPLQALDVWHEAVWLPPEILRRGEIQLALKAWSGVLEVPERRRFKLAQLALVDEASEKLFHISRVLLQAIACLDEKELRRMVLLQALDEAYRCIDFSQARSEVYYASVAEALGCLQGQLAELEGAEGTMKAHVAALGHAHIDLAWLWRLRHTREKAARTFTTALHLMREYPEYRFTHSSPQLFKFLKEDYPQIYARVKERIAEGHWEVTGGMWVESDVNIPNGESLVRQFLLGQQYLRREFGVTCRLLWLPDVFGYSWALPQIARQSGIDYFLTSKISWNQFNRFPYDTFRWRGIDGTELLTYFITTPAEDNTHLTYNGQLSPREVLGTWKLYNQKETNQELLTLFGWGDGGGGPTREMLESGRVLRDLPGFPLVHQERAEAFFARLAHRLPQDRLPVWDGELYLELHRGTYTSQAANKRANRQAEILFHNAEWLSALAALLGGVDYPAGALHEGWEKLLLNQFHDILPGSSIRQVYEDSREDYARIEAIGRQALAAAQETIEGGMARGQDALVVYNPLSWQREGLVALPLTEALAGKTLQDGRGQRRPAQVVVQEGQQKLLLQAPATPSLGYASHTLVPAEGPVAATSLQVEPGRIENEFVRLTLDDRGQLTSIWDKRRQREVLAQGARGNVLQTFVDKPLKFDAWDIDIFYQDAMREIDDLLEAEVEEAGPLRGVLRLRWRFLDSAITQRITLYAHSPRIDFRTDVDWQEKQILLKVAFPVDVRATRATYDIQFGSIERPTHWNTSWDYARFEVVGQKWADLSEGDYGVALLNDCKYGYDVKDNVMRLTLIKSAVRPDALADKGQHRFTYSLLPHEGDWRQGDVVRQAYELNNPLHAALFPLAQSASSRSSSGSPTRFQFAAVDAGHVILETVKQAEDGDGWIVRLYEYQQKRRQNVALCFGLPLAHVVACNLLEEAVHDPSLQHEGNRVTFDIEPYQIKSFRVWFEELED
jgi:alpha-mannosidase